MGVPSEKWRIYAGGHLGQVWRSYGDANTPLPVTALAPVGSDIVWAVLHDEIVVYAQRKWQYVSSCAKICADSHPVRTIYWWYNQLWLAGKGLWTYREGILQFQEMLPDDRVIGIDCDASNRLVVGFQYGGVWQSRDGQYWENLGCPVDGGRIHALTVDTLGDIWVVVQGEASYPPINQSARRLRSFYSDQMWTTAPLIIWKYDAVARVWVEDSTIPHPARVVAMAIDQSRGVWIGTEGDGVWHKSASLWTQTKRKPHRRGHKGLPSDSILALYVENGSQIWSTHLYGLELGVYDSASWRSVFVVPSDNQDDDEHLIWVPNHTTSSYYQGDRGRIWIGTAVGEVGYVDIAALNHISPPDKVVNYQAIRFDV